MAEVKTRSQSSGIRINEHLKKFGAVYAFLFLVIILSQKRRKVKTISDILPRETEERRLPAE